MGQYEARYPVGTSVRVASVQVLRAFIETWRHHNPLPVEHLSFAGHGTEILTVGFYHGGDVLYELRGVPGVWHESCLADVME
ncbi:MAG: hypothetical protein ACKVS8_09630 [Phycisphaerales bacterium]